MHSWLATMPPEGRAYDRLRLSIPGAPVFIPGEPPPDEHDEHYWASVERELDARGAVDEDFKPGRQHAGISSASSVWFEENAWSESGIPPRPWLAPGYFLRGAVTVLIGPGGVSKSMVTITYAVGLALGIDVHGMRPLGPFRCMIYNVEDGVLEQRRRFSAALTSMGRNPADIAGKVARVGPLQLGMLLARDQATGRLHHTAAWDELERHVQSFRPDVLVLDPLAELHSEEENANVALREVVAEFRSFAVKHGLALVLVHHTRKGPVTPGDMDAGRGASSIASAARVLLTLTGMTDEEAKALGISSERRGDFFRLDGAKSNYAALAKVEWFERRSYTLENGDSVAVPFPWTPPVQVVSLETRMTIESAVAAGSSVGPWSVKLSDDARSIKHLLIKHGITTVQGQRAAIASLLAAGFVVAEFRKPGTAPRRKASGRRTACHRT